MNVANAKQLSYLLQIVCPKDFMASDFTQENLGNNYHIKHFVTRMVFLFSFILLMLKSFCIWRNYIFYQIFLFSCNFQSKICIVAMIFFRARPAALWGAAFSLVGLYLTDWKVVLGNVPFIKAKYDWKTPR